MKFGKTLRGFTYAEFKDSYNKECSVQVSSCAEEYCLWVGITDGRRMHLNRAQVKELIDVLNYFMESEEE